MFEKNEHVNIILPIAKGMQRAGFDGNYLELGVRKCPTFNVVAPLFKKSTAVDMDGQALKNVRVKGSTRFCGTTDEYFEQCREGFDLIFIDACHNFENVKKDLDNSIRCLKQFGLILIHDTYPPEKKYISEHYCSDAYKIRDYIKEIGYDDTFESITLPFYFGVTIVTNDVSDFHWYN